MEIRDPIANDADAAPELVLHPLSASDAGATAELIRTAFAAQNRRMTPPSSALLETGSSIAAKIAVGGGFGVFEGGALIAAVLWGLNDDALHIARVSVAPEARGRGIVRLLIGACETEARRRGVRGITLKTRLELPENERMFERCGFARREIEAHPRSETPTIAAMEKVLR
jgi:ribosomal protein S18 acetylase RimI-like enzyme